MVTGHLTMKLFLAKCHERETLRKLWRQTGNSSVLPEMLTAVARDQRWPDVVAGILARLSKLAFVLFCNITNYFMTGWLIPWGTVNFVSLGSQCLTRLLLGKHWFSGNKIHCSPRDQSLSVNCSPRDQSLSDNCSPILGASHVKVLNVSVFFT